MIQIGTLFVWRCHVSAIKEADRGAGEAEDANTGGTWIYLQGGQTVWVPFSLARVRDLLK
jgi:hypothetical protein